MARPKSTSPTDAELEILKVAWAAGVVTVCDVHDVLVRERSVDITTVTTTVSSMVEKGLLRVVDDKHPQKYEAARDQEQTYVGLIKGVADRLHGGSIRQLVQHALGGRKATPAERARAMSRLEDLKQ